MFEQSHPLTLLKVQRRIKEEGGPREECSFAPLIPSTETAMDHNGESKAAPFDLSVLALSAPSNYKGGIQKKKKKHSYAIKLYAHLFCVTGSKIKCYKSILLSMPNLIHSYT